MTFMDKYEKEREDCDGSGYRQDPVGIGFFRNRVLLTASPAMARMLGYAPDELPGKSAAILYPSQWDFERIGRELYEAMAANGFAAVNTRWVRKDGREFECYLKACPVYGNDPYNGLVVTATVDRSGSQQTEAALRSEQERFQILVEEAPFGVALIDHQGGYQYINPEFTRMFGYTLADIPTGRQWFQKAFPDAAYRQNVVTTWDRDMKRAEGNRYRTFRVTCKNGGEKTVHFRPASLSTGEQLVIYTDITKQKCLEAQLMQSQKMEAMGTLASGVAHDFNNILGAILGYAELAQIETPAECEKIGYCLDNILKAGTRAKELVRQILAFRRGNDMEVVPVGLRTIIEEAAKLLRAALPPAIELSLSMSSPDDQVQADPTQLHQLLLNLGTNAHHAMSDRGGILTITLESVAISTRELTEYPELHLGVYRRLKVKDTGCGMPPEVLKRVFDPYYTTKGKDLGTGLGLAVVHTIVQSNGGAIRVQSAPGAGTEFSILLPAFQGQSPSADLPAGRPPRGSERILFVDDEEALVDLGERILKYLGYTVSIETSPMGALELFNRDADKFSLVITDMNMPQMSGVQLSCNLLKIRPDIPIILCTGQSDDLPEEKMRTSGIGAVIMKPLVVHEIARAIRKQLDG